MCEAIYTAQQCCLRLGCRCDCLVLQVSWIIYCNVYERFIFWYHFWHKTFLCNPPEVYCSCSFGLCLLCCVVFELCCALRWRHNDHAGVSNHQPHGCLLNRLFRRKSKKTSKLRVTGLCVGNSPGTGEFPAQMASYAENVSISWRHHVWLRSILSNIRKLYKHWGNAISAIKQLWIKFE